MNQFIFCKRALWLSAICFATWIGSSTASQAHLVIYSVNLTGANESPANGSPGIGSGTIELDEDIVSMKIDIVFSGLVGNVTSAHIHAATANPFTGTAGVATQLPTFDGFPSGVNKGTYSHTFDLADAASYNPAFIAASGGLVSDALNALIFAAEDGKAYLNIHTTAFPGGEIRGFLVAVPEPSSFLLLGLVGAGMIASSRKVGNRLFRKDGLAR